MANNSVAPEIRAHMRRVPLSIPAMADGKVITEVYIRHPTGKYLQERASLNDESMTDADRVLLTVELATGLTSDEVLDLDMEDIATINDEVADFFESRASQAKTPNDGAASSQTAQPS
ncbi:MAG: Phage tail assembly chaperone protein or 41 or 14 [Pseudomonadota bacterium]|jgi:hypothetical protein